MTFCDSPLLVSLHIPKTAGSTFRQVLRTVYGSRLYEAYPDARNSMVPEDVRCVHGHLVFGEPFEILERSEDARWITFLRDPLEGAVSLYHYRVARRQRGLSQDRSFQDCGLEHWLTTPRRLSTTVFSEYNHDRYSKWFQLRCLEDFDFVGLTSRFDESLLILSRLFGWNGVHYVHENRGNYSPTTPSKRTLARFAELNANDYAKYRAAKELFELHCQRYGPDLDRDLREFRERLAR